VLGVLGALDPHTHKTNQASLSGEGKLEKEGVGGAGHRAQITVKAGAAAAPAAAAAGPCLGRSWPLARAPWPWGALACCLAPCGLEGRGHWLAACAGLPGGRGRPWAGSGQRWGIGRAAVGAACLRVTAVNRLTVGWRGRRRRCGHCGTTTARAARAGRAARRTTARWAPRVRPGAAGGAAADLPSSRCCAAACCRAGCCHCLPLPAAGRRRRPLTAPTLPLPALCRRGRVRRRPAAQQRPGDQQRGVLPHSGHQRAHARAARPRHGLAAPERALRAPASSRSRSHCRLCAVPAGPPLQAPAAAPLAHGACVRPLPRSLLGAVDPAAAARWPGEAALAPVALGRATTPPSPHPPPPR
jgi:hypothetical protein